MPETLISEAMIHLFGRVVDDLVLKTDAYGAGAIASAVKDIEDGKLARVYAFAFQNEFFELASPALFVVSGDGQKVGDTLDQTGLARIPDKLNPTLMFWTVERDSFTVRLDVQAGSFNRVLLDYELADTALQDFVRGGKQLGTPTAVSSRSRRRPRGWRSDDE